MSVRKISFKNSFLLFLMLIFPATPWTIDLPEIRKHLFEKNAELKKDEKNNLGTKDRYYYTNKEGNSMHNTKHYEDVYENSPYAQEYGYQTYMEKKVNDIVYRGGKYLDGLQRSLEEYSRVLESCRRMNRTRSESNSTSWRPAHETNFTSINSTLPSCESATRASEHVRRLSQLALSTTRDLQDIAYQRKYNKGDMKEVTMEENELILKLSWFLDRLAHYTGYEPDTTGYPDTEDPPTTSPPPVTAPSIMNAPDEVKLQMMKCLEEKSDVPATVRCAYPLPMPDLARQIQNYTDEVTSRMSPNPSSSNINERVELMSVRNQEPELLVASETFAPNPTPVKREKREGPEMLLISEQKPFKREASNVKIVVASEYASNLTPVKIIKRQRRSENSGVNFLNHFTKTKAWIVENSEVKSDSGEFEVKNDLPKHIINKRSIEIVNKKYQHFKLPEDPFQDLSNYVKHRPGINYIKDDAQAAKIKAYLDKINSKTIKKSLVQKLNKKFLNKVNEKDNKDLEDAFKKSFVQKRSVKFEKDVDLPRISEDPQQDISYYVKNKPGTNVENNLLQAVQVRAGLEQAFQTGNIEVVRRFGANYNPLIPAPFYVAIMKSMADNI